MISNTSSIRADKPVYNPAEIHKASEPDTDWLELRIVWQPPTKILT